MGKYKRESPRNDLVKYEQNFAEYSPFYPGRGKTPPIMEHNFDIKNRNGDITGKGSITVKNAEGIPGPFEQDIFFVFSKLFEEQGYPKEIKFATHGVAERMERKWSGRTKEQIQEGVRTIKETNYIFRGIGRGPMIGEMGFNLFDGYTFYERKEHLTKKGIPYTAAKKVNYVSFSDIMKEAIKTRNYKLMDPTIYFSLPSGLPRTFYLYLEKKGLWKTHFYREKIKSLSNHLGLDIDQNIYELTRTIDKTIDILKKKKVISCGRNEDKRIFSTYPKQKRKRGPF